MTVSGVSSASSIYRVDLSSVSQNATAVPADDPAPTNVSPMGDMMSKLQQLSQSDPSKFKQVMAEIADKLKAVANDSSGQRADFLGKLADKFQQAGQSGDMSAFKPPQGSESAHHRHGHHAHAAASADAAQQGRPSDSLAQIIESALQSASVSG